MYLGLHVKCPIFCPIFTKFGFCQIFMKSSITIVMEFHPVGAVLIHVDTWTGMPGNRCFTWLWMHLKVKCKVPTVFYVNWGLYYTCINQNRTIVCAQAQYHVSPQCEEKLWKRHTHMNRHDCQHHMLILCTLSRECTDKLEQRKPPYWSNDDVKFNILTAMTTKITSSGMCLCVIG